MAVSKVARLRTSDASSFFENVRRSTVAFVGGESDVGSTAGVCNAQLSTVVCACYVRAQGPEVVCAERRFEVDRRKYRVFQSVLAARSWSFERTKCVYVLIIDVPTYVYFARQFSYCQPLAPRIHCYSQSRFALATSPIHQPHPKSWLRARHRRCTSVGRFATRLCTLARRRCLCFGSCSWCCLPRCSSCQHSVGTS